MKVLPGGSWHMRNAQYMEVIRVPINSSSIIPRRQQIDKVLKLAQPSEEEAWSLFKENLGLLRSPAN